MKGSVTAVTPERRRGRKKTGMAKNYGGVTRRKFHRDMMHFKHRITIRNTYILLLFISIFLKETPVPVEGVTGTVGSTYH